ncbi:MAG: aspartate kinase [Bacteroides sp.]|nr:aspartate kinase [Bacteroides sp.]
MKVLKFGGTSVGSVESLLNVKDIVESISEPTVVVVSALGGLTDKLIATANMAASGNPAFREEMEAISLRHFNIISNTVKEAKRADTINKVSQLLSELQKIFEGLALIRDLSERTLCVVVSYGERMSSHIVAAMIEGATRHDSLEFIKTEKWFGKDIADQKLTSTLISKEFANPFNKAIVPGFISTDRDSGAITNLGRGGSDFTAALIAAALDAEILEIWTDVDGFMTADPRIIPEAEVVPFMSFIESMELCTFGAKVIYPPTIYPVFHKNIPIKILNTFNPTAPGTLITDNQLDNKFPIKGVSTLRNTTIFTLTGIDDDRMSEISTRTLNALARHGIKIFLLNHDDSPNEYSFGVAGADADITARQLLSEFAPELSTASISAPIRKDSLSTIAMVGENMKERSRLAGRIWHTLNRDGIIVEAYSAGNSDTTITYVVDADKADRALELIHGLVFHE